MSVFFDGKIEKIMNEKCIGDEEYFNFCKYIISRVKADIERMWDRYEIYAPKGFKKNAIVSKEDFYERWWEMYLGCKMLDYGYDILKDRKKDEGPDLKISVGNNIYWIENVAPERGKNLYSLPKMELGEDRLPREEFLLRLNNSIENKIIKYNEYIKKGIVKDTDKKIIAISTCNLDQYGSLMDFPELAIETLVFNKGDLTINLKTGNKVLKEKGGIKVKDNKGDLKIIPTKIFLITTCIDGIIYSHDEPLNIYNKLYLIENPNSKLNDRFKKNFIVN